ncbi:DCN1 protein 4 [Pelomyxa schiedti]|nr:DCN1 protein 4 [Pelomyxa schiedti]
MDVEFGSMFPALDENVVQAVVLACSGNVDAALSILLAYASEKESSSGANDAGEGAVVFLVEMFPDTDIHLIKALSKINEDDTDHTVGFLMEFKNQLDSLGGPARKPGQLTKVDKQAAIEAQFQKYASIPIPGAAPPTVINESSVINSEGVTQLLSDMKIAPDSLSALIFAWQMGEKTMGIITHNEFVEGMQHLGCSSPEEARKKLEELQVVIKNNRQKFSDLYQYAFNFCKDTEVSTVIDVSMAIPMWEIIMTCRPNLRYHTSKLIEFLRQNKAVKAINRDQWLTWPEFAQAIPQNYDGYDSSQPWPLLFDDYVSWVRSPPACTPPDTGMSSDS